MSNESFDNTSGRPTGAPPQERTRSYWAKIFGTPWFFITAAMVALLLSVWGMIWIVGHPESTAYEILQKASELTLRPEREDTDEYLVFMGEDTPGNRRQLLASSAHVSYVAESLLPSVIVVRVTDNLIETLDTLRGQDYVRLIFKYNPSFGCH